MQGRLMSINPISIDEVRVLQRELTERCQQLQEQIRRIQEILERLQENGMIYLPPETPPPKGMYS